MTENVLSVRDLCLGYGGKDIVHNVSFDLKKSEILGVVGLNGTGKTTLIKSLVGLRQIRQGSIEKEAYHIAFLPERFEAPAFLTGFEYLQFSLKAYGKKIDLEEAQQHAASISLGQDSLQKRIKTYSKGMRQKIGILAVMLAKSPVTILDEPMSGLDPKARIEMKALIKQAPEEGRSILMTSHILTDMTSICDRIMVLHQGKQILLGSSEELLKRGANDDVEQAFLNLIEGKQ